MGYLKFTVFLLLFPLTVYSQTGVSDDFNDNVLASCWNPSSQYSLAETGSELVVTTNKTSYDNFEFVFPAINLSSNPTLSIKVKSSVAFTLRIDLGDAAGNYTNATPTSVSVTAGATYNTYNFNFSGKFNQTFPSAATVDGTQITKIDFFFNPGSNFTGTVYFEDLVAGTGGSSCSSSGVAIALSSDIRLNQIGFYPNCSKIGIVKDASAGPFYITLPDGSDTLFTGTLGSSANWSYSNENVRVADFSSFNTLGDYILVVPGKGKSYDFTIDSKVHVPVNKASIKFYYFQRACTALLAANAGTYARAEGHTTEDNAAVIHTSAATGPRPAGTVLSSLKGWYDAGDYNKYIVNSGISTYTLLSAYEHYPTYYDTLNTNIPESVNALPDILDEIKWNLDWMLTMQDPNDGGVYHKLTNTGFDGMIMPNAATATRYFCKKATAATFDFAAVMATAYRVFKPFDLTFANQCLTAAQNAYTWGIANPGITFTNPAGVSTGEYGDGTLTDEKEWAATELYISTLNDTYYTNSFKNTNFYGVPSWPNVNTLGLISLIHNRKNLTALGYADTTNMKNKLLNISDPLRTQANSTSAYRVPMGTAGTGDFVWGSNGQAANQGMILMQAYRMTNDQTYFTAALSALDYLNGRNATTYAFVTGNGDKTPMHPHHRPSEADGITNPVPGMLVGGPNTDALGDCGSGYPSTTLKALAYQDALCSYSTNEVAINWNAPYAYLSGAIEAINPCGSGSLPVSFLSVSAKNENDMVKIDWSTASEKDNDYFLIQRSINGKVFDKIGQVEGAGNSFSTLDYAFYDPAPLKGLSYYRIAQVDKDGSVSYSTILRVENKSSFEVSIYPNPSSGTITIQSDLSENNITFSDLMGREVFPVEKETDESFVKQYDLSPLPKGLYIVSIHTLKGNYSKRIVLQ